MADHPFANSGLGMYGAAENMYAKSAMQGDGKNGLLGKAAGALAKELGLEEFLNKAFGGDSSVQPEGSVPPANPMAQQGINPMMLPGAVPGGVGLNAKPAGAANPFQFPITPAPQLTPDEEYRNQIKNAWS
jgi:hypothetical protein